MIETSSKATGVTYTITGVIEEVNGTKLKITELPVRSWTVDYKEFLESMCPQSEQENGNEKNKGKGKVKVKEPPFLEVGSCSNSYFSRILDFFLTFFKLQNFCRKLDHNVIMRMWSLR